MTHSPGWYIFLPSDYYIFAFLNVPTYRKFSIVKKKRERENKKVLLQFLWLKKKDTPHSQSESPFSICNVTSLILASFVCNFKNLFIYLAVQGLSCRIWALGCSMWDLVP